MGYCSSIGYLALMYGDTHYSTLMETAQKLNYVATNDFVWFDTPRSLCFTSFNLMQAQTKLGTILLSPGCLQEPTLQIFFPVL